MKKLVDCEHCGGRKNCSKAGGKSCDVCLAAAGRRRRDWATVRCSFCGGRGKVLIEVEEASAEQEPADSEATS